MTNMVQNPYTDQYAAPEAATELVSSRWQLNPGGIVLILGALLLAGMVAYGIYQNEQSTLVDGPAPDFALSIYDDSNINYQDASLQMVLSGETLNLSDMEGPVVLNFWRTNCPPCHDEAPMLTRVYEDYRNDGVQFIGINVKDPDALAYNYLARYSITYPNGLDRADEIQGIYRTSGQPETFVIDAQGNITHHWSGPPTEAALRAAIDAALVGNS